VFAEKEALILSLSKDEGVAAVSYPTSWFYRLTMRSPNTRSKRMPNIHRGEIAAAIGGETRVLCLTLGALAELEAQLGAGDLAGLAERFAGGKVSARDLTAIIGAGLRGGGSDVSDDQLAQMSVEGGLRGAADIAVRLLKATFGEAE